MSVPDLDNDGSDPQDQAEAYDETHNTDELGYPDETRSFAADLFDDAYDATSAQGDADEDDVAVEAADLDEDDLDQDDDAEEGELLYLDDDLEDEDDDLLQDGFQIERSAGASSANEAPLEYTDNLDDAGRTSDRMARRYESPGELSQADVRSLGYGDDKKETDMGDDDKAKGTGAAAEDIEDESHPHQEELLDEGVEETFPASDPVSVKHIT